MVTKEEILSEISEILDSRITINGDVYIDYHKPVLKKKTSSAQKKDNVKRKTGSVAAQMRTEVSMTQWKRAIHSRDHVCQCCGDAVDLECHHVMPLAKYPSLGTDPGNGILLCGSCHHDYHEQWQGSENAVTLARFMKENVKF